MMLGSCSLDESENKDGSGRCESDEDCKGGRTCAKPTLACHGDGVRAMMAALLRNCWCSLMANLLLQNGSFSEARMDISASIWV